MASRWTHRVCAECYAKFEEGRDPVKFIDPDPPDKCCSCGKSTDSGIYYRYDPASLLCRGVIGEVHKEVV